MTVFRSLAMAGWALQGTLRQAAKPSIWLPFLVITLFQLLGLEAILSFYRPGLSVVVLPLVRGVGGDAATHYPTFFAALPTIFARLDLILGVVVASLATGAATVLFARAFGEVAPRAWSTAARRYLPLAGIALLSALLSLVIFLLGGHFIQEVVADRLLRWLVRFGVMLTFIVAESFLIYASVAIVLDGRGFLGSIRDSVRMAAKILLPTIVVVGIPVILAYPLDYLAGRSDLFLTKFRPELVTGVLLAKIVAELVLGFLLVGAITRLYVWRRREGA